MTRSKRAQASGKLFEDSDDAESRYQELTPGAVLLRAFALSDEAELVAAIDKVDKAAPFRHMITPGGFRMSVAMTNCGRAGWVTDRSGYRYDALDPVTGLPWPPMPKLFDQLATRAATEAGFAGFKPDSCLINRYEPGAKLSLHQDRNEKSFDAPIVSFSLGLPAKFLFGGLNRTDKVQRLRLESGDVVVWGGPARLAFHGVDTLADGNHPVTGCCRLNLTFRRAIS